MSPEIAAEDRIASRIWSASSPVSLDDLSRHADLDGDSVLSLLRRMAARHRDSGFVLVETAGGWAYRSNPELSDHVAVDPASRLSEAALEILVIVVAFGPVTRTEIENFRQTSVAPVTLAGLLERGLIKPGRRRNTPGRPLTWIIHDRFFEVFDIPDLDSEMPDLAVLRALKDIALPGGLSEIEPAPGDDGMSASDLDI